MKKIGILIFLTVIMFSGLTAQNMMAQQLSVKAIPLEKISLNTDRNLYVVGEKLWFKAYYFSSSENLEENLSNVLYVELYDVNKETTIKRKFKIKDKATYGAIDIPSAFKSGNYILRAYTQYLKNFSPDYYYTQSVQIINPYKQLPKPTKPESEIVDIIVEGNKLLNQVKTKVYFSIREDYIGITEKVEILEENQLLHSFEHTENGLGIFELKPELNKTYRLKLYSSSDTIIKDFPIVKGDGMAIRLDNDVNGFFNIRIFNKKGETLNAQLEILDQYLNLLQTKELLLNKEIHNLGISKEMLKTGINHFVLKDLNGDLLSAASIYNGTLLNLNVKTDNYEYLNRDLVTLEIESNDLRNLKNVSVSVFKKGSLFTGLNRSLLINPVLLKSHLSNHLLEDKYLDIALISYTNFILPKELQEAGSKLKVNWIPEIRDASISGVAVDVNSKAALANKPIYLSVFKQDPQIHIDKTKADGSFVFSLNNFEGDHELFISLEPESNLEYEILINNDFQNSFSRISNLNLNINQSHRSLIEEMSINMQANKLFDTESYGQEKAVLQLPFSLSQAEEVIDLTQYINSPDLHTVFRELIPKVVVRKKQGNYSVRIFDGENGTSIHNPLVLVDNLPVFNMNELMAIPPIRVLKISIFKNKFMIGDEILHGVIMISTDTRDFGGIKFNPGSVFMDYQTISNPLKLDPINYSLDSFKNQTLADFRNLLHWEPQLIFKESQQVRFYTSDHDSEYEIFVRGFTATGQMCFGKTSFIVK